MGKSRVSQKADAVQPGDRVSLSDVAIIYHRESHFIGEEGDVPVTISGVDLGRVLHWMSRDAPGHPTRFSGAEFLATKVRAVGFLCRMVASSDRIQGSDEVEAIMWLLGDLLDDKLARLPVIEKLKEPGRVRASSSPRSMRPCGDACRRTSRRR